LRPTGKPVELPLTPIAAAPRFYSTEGIRSFTIQGLTRIHCKIIFHIDEAMSWECVHDLNQMYPLINLIHNLVNQNEAPERILETIIAVNRNFEEVRTALIDIKFAILQNKHRGLTSNVRESTAARYRCIYERLPKPWAANRRTAGIRKICTSILCMVTTKVCQARHRIRG